MTETERPSEQPDDPQAVYNRPADGGSVTADPDPPDVKPVEPETPAPGSPTLDDTAGVELPEDAESGDPASPHST